VELFPLIVILCFPIWSIYSLRQSGARGDELWRRLFNPTANWYNTERPSDKEKGEGIDNRSYASSE